VASNLLHLVAKRMKRHYSKVADQRMSVQEVEKLAREAAAKEGVKAADEPATGGSCTTNEEDCPTCSDSLPGEQKDRTPDATVKAAAGTCSH
jgi:hypothetical protein